MNEIESKKIELDFKPDLICYYITLEKDGSKYCGSLWGDKKVYETCRIFIYNLIKNQPGKFFFFMENSSLNYKIIPAEINNYTID